MGGKLALSAWAEGGMRGADFSLGQKILLSIAEMQNEHLNLFVLGRLGQSPNFSRKSEMNGFLLYKPMIRLD